MYRFTIGILVSACVGGALGLYSFLGHSPETAKLPPVLSAELDKAFRSTLAQIGKTPAAVEGYRDLDRLVRANPQLEELSADMMPMLLPALSVNDDAIRKHVFSILVHLSIRHSKSTLAAYPILAKIARDDKQDRGIRDYALEVISFMGPRDDLRPILPLLKDPDPNVRGLATSALRRVGHSYQAVPLLIEALKDEDAGVRSWAALALSARGAQARASFRPLLHTWLADPDERVQSCSAGALRSIDRELYERISR